MNPVPCRRCRAEAFVEPQALGWKVECIVCPAEHQAGPYKSREKAVRVWNERQREIDEASDRP